MSDRKKLLVSLDVRHTASRRMIGGIMRFAATHPAWEVQLAEAHPSDRPLADFIGWKPDAFITDGGCHALPRETFARLFKTAVVYVNTPPRRDSRKTAATIRSDERALATAAADLFLRRKLPNFAFVGAPGSEWWSEARERLFRAYLKDRHLPLHVFDPPASGSWRQRERALAGWLRDLPKPCGVWAAYDQRAKCVLDAARLAGLDVPEQLLVLGVDDERTICEYTSPALSSVVPDFEAGGYQALEFLDAVVCRGQRPEKRLTALKFGLLGIVERLSTADTNGVARRRVAEASEFIRRSATAGISVPAVAAAVRVSRRLLEQNFREITGRTVLDFIQDARFEKVMQMLKETETPIEALSHFCGFRSPTHLMTLFRRRYGQTMTAYRRQLQRAAE